MSHLTIAVLLDQAVHSVAVRHPADQTRVIRQGHDRVTLDAEIDPSRRSLARQKRVDKTEQLHHPLVLPQVFPPLEQE